MLEREISAALVHALPADLKGVLVADEAVLNLWKGLTPLARNKWICWVGDAKKNDTRNRRIARTIQELKEGKRRPCCWPGCSTGTGKTDKFYRLITPLSHPVPAQCRHHLVIACGLYRVEEA